MKKVWSIGCSNMVVVCLVVLAALLPLVEPGRGLKLYPYLPDPSLNPDYERYAVRHPTLDVFGNTPQFATLRNIPTILNGSELNYKAIISRYCLNSSTTLGRMLYPRRPSFFFVNNYADFINYLKSQGLYMTTVHGFSPVSAGYRPPPKVLEYLEKTLGDRWLGISNGEQDGHYFDAFIGEELPKNTNHKGQYLHFRDYFTAMENILGPRMTTLLSDTYPHYEIKSGLYTLAGAETSQHGPNAQIRYSFIRGAGKQYGVLWFGNVSVYNRWGHKVYKTPSKTTSSDNLPMPNPKLSHKYGDSPQRNYTCKHTKAFNLQTDGSGPTCGTSLNLMKRLMYAHIMYHSAYASFEDNWFYNAEPNVLSPIGLIQHNAYLWTMKFASLGTHVPTIALYLDFFNGWATPRLKRGSEFHVWYNLPYMEGDYLSDGIFRVIYPSYQDASYFHNETGVSSPTPYGDALDVLLSDASSWVLKQYDTVIVSSNIDGGMEVEHNLNDYLTSGGNLILTAGNLAKLPMGSLTVTTNLNCKFVPSGSTVHIFTGESMVEKYNMTVCDIDFPPNSTVLAWLEDHTPLAVQMPAANNGSLTVFATPFAISSDAVARPSSQEDVTLPSPYPLLDHAQTLLNNIFTNATLFTSSANLSLVPTHTSKDQFYLLVSNPELREQPMKLLSPQGKITSLEEIPLDQSEKGAEGYLPDGFEGADIGHSTNTTIAGGDTRLFAVTLSSDLLHFLPKVQPKPRPIGVALHLRHIDHSIRYEVLLRPTFFQHYDSVVVDYSYLITKDDDFLKQESRWLKQQNLSVCVDASPSVNLFPTLRLTNDAPDLHNQTMQSLTRLLYKMNALGSCDLIMSLHIFPNHQTHDESLQDFNNTLHYLDNLGSQLNITVHMLDAQKNPLDVIPFSRWLLSCNLTSINFIMNTARLVTYDYRAEYDVIIKSHSSMLYVNAPGWDMYGLHYANNVPLSKVNSTLRTQVEDMIKHICTLRQCPYQFNSTTEAANDDRHYTQQKAKERNTDIVYPIVMDAMYADRNEEFTDIHLIENLLLQA